MFKKSCASFRTLILCAALMLPLLGVTPGAAAPSQFKIIIRDMKFIPDTITVKMSDRITWVNEDIFPHTATSSSYKFDSKEIETNKKWSLKVKSKGTFDYICKFHPTMKGHITIH